MNTARLFPTIVLARGMRFALGGLGTTGAGIALRVFVGQQRAAHHIITPADASIPNTPVTDIPTALSMAASIQQHAAERSNGLPFAQMGRFAVASGDPAGTNSADDAVKDASGNPVANQARNTHLQAAGHVTALSRSAMALGLAYGAIALGVALLVLGLVITGLGRRLLPMSTPARAPHGTPSPSRRSHRARGGQAMPGLFSPGRAFRAYPRPYYQSTRRSTMTPWHHWLGRLGTLALVLTTTLFSASRPLAAATLTPTCTTTSLLDAFTTATTNRVADTINLPAGCVYTFTTAAATTATGSTALPIIANQVPGVDLTINGNGATLRRDLAAPTFRLLEVTYQAEAVIRNLTIEHGRAPEGGGIAITWQAAGVTVSNVTFRNNQATGLQGENGGGAIFAHETSLVVENSTFTGNSTTPDQQHGTGGAIKNLLSDLTIRNSTFTENRTGYGGAVYIDGTNRTTSANITITRSRFTQNAARDGGGIYACLYEASETLRLDASTVANNTVTGQGGGVVRNCTGQFHLANSAIVGNTAGQGGGLEIDKVSATITNSTIANNTAGDTGGGVHLYRGQMTTNNVTIVGNVAGYGGGIAGGDATTRLSNTIVHNRATNPYGTRFNCSGAQLSSGGGNVEFPGTTNDVNDRDCTLGPTIGDPTVLALTQGSDPPVLPLAAASAAINAGNPSTCLARDQRGYTRHGVCDSGAYEYNGAPVTVTTRIVLPLVRR